MQYFFKYQVYFKKKIHTLKKKEFEDINIVKNFNSSNIGYVIS